MLHELAAIAEEVFNIKPITITLLRLTLCQEILSGFIPSLFRVFAIPSSEVAWDGPQMK